MAAKERQAARVAARAERQAKRQTTRATRKKHRVERRTAIKKIRADKELSGYDKRMKIGGTRAFHKVDGKGNVGGFKAYFAHAKKVSPAMTKRADRIKGREDRKTERAAAKDTKKERTASMKEKQASSSHLRQDTEFFKRNARVRGMSIQDYYAKYVK